MDRDSSELAEFLHVADYRPAIEKQQYGSLPDLKTCREQDCPVPPEPIVIPGNSPSTRRISSNGIILAEPSFVPMKSFIIGASNFSPSDAFVETFKT